MWRDDSRNWISLFTAEASEWEAKLLEDDGENQLEGPDYQSKAEALTASRPRDLTDRPDRVSETNAVRAEEKTARTRTHARMSFSIRSGLAATRLEAYLTNNDIGMTEFAIKLRTTDRTLRKFRTTGGIGRTLFDAIAREMGTTREALLKP